MNKIDIMKNLCSKHWAMDERSFRSMLSAFDTFDVSKIKGFENKEKEIDGTSFAKVQGNIGILEILGPIIPFSSWLEWFGFVSIETLKNDFNVLQNDSNIKSIVIKYDTPGGMVDGISEFAGIIANSKKPVTSFVLGDAASAGYWLASQGEKIYSVNTARVGSIGVVTTIVDFKDFWEKKGIKVFEVVSSQSPRKRTDLTTAEGRAELQAILDGIATVFIDAVARGRGLENQEVIDNFGSGGMFVADDALERGMIDGIIDTSELYQTFENDNNSFFRGLKIQSLIKEKDQDFKDKEITRNENDSLKENQNMKEKKMNDERSDLDIAKIKNEATQKEQERIKLIESISTSYEGSHPNVRKEIVKAIDTIKFDSEKSFDSAKLEISTIAFKAQEKVIADMRKPKAELAAVLESVPDVSDQNNEIDGKIKTIETVDPNSSKIKDMVKGFESVR